MGVGSRWVRSVVVLGLAAAGAAVPAFAQTSFQWLGNLPDTTSGGAIAVARDGSTVLGVSVPEAGLPQYWLWRAETGHVPILGAFEIPADIDLDGDVVVGTTVGGQSFRWTSATGTVFLEDLPGGDIRSAALAVSDDGLTVYGQGSSVRGAVGMRWTAKTGMVDLGLPFISEVECATPDGSVLAGSIASVFTREMYRFMPGSGELDRFGDLAGGAINSRAFAISDDGETVVGYASTAAGQVPAMWTQETGLVALDTTLGGIIQPGFANAVSFDGLLIGGSIALSGTSIGYVWSRDGAKKYVWDSLECEGVDSPSGLASAVTDIAVTTSSVTLVGTGQREFDGAFEGWIATYPYIPPEVACRSGNINEAATCPVDVLFINDSVGSHPERVIDVTPTTPITLRLDAAPSGGKRYALYMWRGQPTEDTVRILPEGTGTIGMPCPATPGPPQPQYRANNIGRFLLLGSDTWPGPAPLAPAILMDRPGGLGKTGTFYFQGILIDSNAPNGRAGVTNGIVLVSQP